MQLRDLALEQKRGNTVGKRLIVASPRLDYIEEWRGRGASGRRLACPTWILLPYTPDYRWLLDRDDSPWYPTVRLFRQDASRDYAGAIERISGELQAKIAARSCGR